jgi:hypothetical protein
MQVTVYLFLLSFQNAKVDDWMEKMNTEFSEIEGFELSIEDNL